MGLLAYDPERVAFLKHRLRAAAEELHTIRSTETAAIDAMRAVATIRNEIDQVWIPLVTRILENTSLTNMRWFQSELDGHLQNALINVMASGYGWSVQIDPLYDNQAIVTPAEARALGAMLNSADLATLVDDRQQLRWLAQQLWIIGADAALSAEFLGNFDAWTTLTYVLGREHAEHERPDIAATFDGLMAVWTHTLQPDVLRAGKSATLAALLPIEAADPYVQALMVRSLHLDAMTTATVTVELLTRWLTMKNDPTARVSVDRHDGTGANAGDLVLSLLLHNPAACAWLTELAANNPAILFETLNDPDVAYQVVLIGTHPTNTTVTAAGQAVLSILDYFRADPYLRPGFDNDGHPGEYGPFLGDLVAPWLVQFTMSNDDWNATDGQKASLLRVALHDEEARLQLVADADRIREGFAEALSTHDISAAYQVGELLNLVLQLSVNELVDDEIGSGDESFNLMWTVVGVASSFLPGGPLVSIAKGFALSALSKKLGEYLDQPDPSGVRRTAERAMDVALTLAGADAVARLHQQWVADGLAIGTGARPPTVDVGGDASWCPSAEYHDDFDRWRSELPGGRDGELSRQANDLLSAFVGSSAAQTHCAEIAG